MQLLDVLRLPTWLAALAHVTSIVVYATCICGQPCSVSLMTNWKATLESLPLPHSPRDSSASQKGHLYPHLALSASVTHIPATVRSRQPSLPPLGWCHREEAHQRTLWRLVRLNGENETPWVSASMWDSFHVSSAVSTLSCTVLICRKGILIIIPHLWVVGINEMLHLQHLKWSKAPLRVLSLPPPDWFSEDPFLYHLQ